ncbi:MAG: DUF1801 domain-containing protein [Erythrobacter sp.]
MDDIVKTAFDQFEAPVRNRLLELRKLILKTANDCGAGPLTETLKWGQPSYLTEATKSGTTIRLGIPKGAGNRCAMFVSCQTSLLSEYREIIDEPAIEFEGNRAVVFGADAPLPTASLEHCIAQALTYKKR